MQNNVEVVHTYRQHIVNDMNPGNLHLFINAYNRYRMPPGGVAMPFPSGSSCRSRARGEGEGNHSVSRRDSPKV